MFDELPVDPQTEAEAVLLLALANREEDSGVAILFPVNLLPLPAAFADALGFDPRGDRDRLGRFESGVVGYFDGVRTTVEDQRLAELTIRVLRGVSTRTKEK